MNFNLVKDDWIPCVMKNGSVIEKSLEYVLLETSSIREIIGDSPPVTISLHRFLLSILHRALKAPRGCEEWGYYWNEKTWDTEGKISRYLNEWNERKRFDLFDDKKPFYQTASVRNSIQNGAVIQLYFQAKANATLFDHSSLAAPRKVTAAEAARLLLAFQNFDVGGIKADGAGGKRAFLLNSAIGLVKADYKDQSLFETLMLNFHVYNEEDSVPFAFKFAKDMPIWERESDLEVVERRPDGYVDLLTWQSRRILLQPKKNKEGEIFVLDEKGKPVVEDIVIMKGNHAPAEYELFDKETMIAFKSNSKKVFVPVTFSENKALWRDSLSLIENISGRNQRPKTLDWLSELVYEGHLSRSAVFPIEFYGLRNDLNNEAKLLFSRHERFNLPLAFLEDIDLLNALKIGLQFAEDLGIVLLRSMKILKKELNPQAWESTVKSAKAPERPMRENNLAGRFPALSMYWASLEIEFQRLAAALVNDRENATCKWFKFVLVAANEAINFTTKNLSGSLAEQKAIVKADSAFYWNKRRLFEENSEYRKYLPKDTVEEHANEPEKRNL